jgi:hypothetical protein
VTIRALQSRGALEGVQCALGEVVGLVGSGAQSLGTRAISAAKASWGALTSLVPHAGNGRSDEAPQVTYFACRGATVDMLFSSAAILRSLCMARVCTYRR